MDIKSALFVCLTACIVFGLCFILIRSKGASVYSVIVKALASFSFVLCFVVSIIYDTEFDSAVIGLAMGLVAGLIGDILLELKVVYSDDSDDYLNAGFISFGVGHFFYIYAMITLAGGRWAVNNLWLYIGIAALIAGAMTAGSYFMMKKLLKYDFGKHTVITFVYSFILFFSTVFAVCLSFGNSSFASIAIGLILFCLSDLILSMQYFGGQQNNNVFQVLNHTSYYLAQIVIASTLFISMLV